MPDSLDAISVLPKMRKAKSAGLVFKLHWVLDLVSNSSYCNVNLLFKNIKNNSILIDTIQPELLSYCTVGSCFIDGKKLDRVPYGEEFEFTIDSASNNRIDETRHEISDAEYNLSLNEKYATYSEISKKQYCFIQQSGNIKIIIPCFVIASAYYFKSTSLRNAILSRRLDSLFHNISFDPVSRHASIYLKSEGNQGDAIAIARLKLDIFANQRLNLCVNHFYANKNNPYKRLKFDFPVEQELSIKARGHFSADRKTFIVFQILRDDSRYPFDSLEVIYEKEEDRSGETTEFSATKTKHSGEISDRLPSDANVRHLLEKSEKIENPNEDKIEVKKTVIPKPPAEKAPETVYDENQTDLSLQPGSLNDGEVSRGTVKEKEEEEDKDKDKKVKQVLPLDVFKKMVDPLNNLFFNLTTGKIEDESSRSKLRINGPGEIKVQVTDYCYSEDLVWKHKSKTKLSLKESYDHTIANRRRCAYVFFTFHGRHVFLVEIDQQGLPGNGCSTMVLISKNIINKASAESAVEEFVKKVLLTEREMNFASKGIILKTKNHPEEFNDNSLMVWRARLLRKVLE
jgi:hypothetical protein